MALTPKLFLKSSFIEVYESDKLEFESETLANYAPPNNSSPSTFIFRDIAYEN